MSTDQVPTTRRPPGQRQGKSRHCVEGETLINARSSTVWDIITDARNYTVWESGITHIRGELRNGGTIRIRSHTGGNRTFRLRVQQVPGEAMTWTQGLPLGLLTGVRTFTLEPRGGMTHLRVKEEFTGPLCGLLLCEFVSDTQQAFNDYVDAVRKRAEILSRHPKIMGH
ncbi:SRPBCC family protein [Arthrobacter sp. NPDC056886]|uniref:SRPBCC family protein n=1 Tax=Arthrobacter sp. NPDC056886 TaxID=3345960 RepID=UPI0036733188